MGVGRGPAPAGLARGGERRPTELSPLPRSLQRIRGSAVATAVIGPCPCGILLDRIAVALVAMFGEAQHFEPSHGGLIRERHGLAAFAHAHGLTSPPASLLEQARELEGTLTHFRDREITHALIYSGRGRPLFTDG